MKHRDFINKLDETKVVAAIADAELKTSGEIRVFVTRRGLAGEPVIERATRQFEALGMTATRDRNGVLLFFAPLEQQFAVIGDTGIHARCGQSFWEHVAKEIHEQLGKAHFTEAVVGAVSEVGSALSRYFPTQEGDRDELSNKVAGD